MAIFTPCKGADWQIFDIKSQKLCQWDLTIKLDMYQIICKRLRKFYEELNVKKSMFQVMLLGQKIIKFSESIPWLFFYMFDDVFEHLNLFAIIVGQLGHI